MKDQGWRAISIVDPRTRRPRDSWTPGLANPGTRTHKSSLHCSGPNFAGESRHCGLLFCTKFQFDRYIPSSPAVWKTAEKHMTEFWLWWYANYKCSIRYWYMKNINLWVVIKMLTPVKRWLLRQFLWCIGVASTCGRIQRPKGRSSRPEKPRAGAKFLGRRQQAPFQAAMDLGSDVTYQAE